MKTLSPENLKQLYPRSPRVIIRENFLWLTLYLGILAGGFLLQDDRSSVRLSLEDILFGLFLGATLVVFIRLVRSVLLNLCLSIDYLEDRLLISTGILLRKREEIFLDKIIDVYTTKGWEDFVLGLSSVGLVLIGRKDLVITGYSKRVARQLQDHIIRLIENGRRNGAYDEPPDVSAAAQPVLAAAR